MPSNLVIPGHKLGVWNVSIARNSKCKDVIVKINLYEWTYLLLNE